MCYCSVDEWGTDFAPRECGIRKLPLGHLLYPAPSLLIGKIHTADTNQLLADPTGGCLSTNKISFLIGALKQVELKKKRQRVLESHFRHAGLTIEYIECRHE